ncbi:RNA dependent RNA polymerase-domain-containing protein [Parasitella parasitica]|nr:RNA dependent RNA polymerase-domain-containing protein [Parasitella parasitica]
MSTLEPLIIRCAKQIYHNLKLTNRIRLLSNAATNNSLPSEVVKMQQIVAIADGKTLERIVRSFLQDSKPNKSLNDFVSLLDQKNQMLICMDDDDFSDEFGDDCVDIFAQIMDTLPEVKKRARPSTLDDTPALHKRLKLPADSVKNAPSNKSKDLTLVINESCFVNDTLQSDTHNTICNPQCATKLLSGVPWIILYEISRFVQAFNVDWSNVPFEAFQTFLNTGSSDPGQLYDTMIKWNQETRLGIKLNGSAYTVMDRCSENVWVHFKQSQTSTPVTPLSSALHPDFAVHSKEQNARIKNRMIHFSGLITWRNSHLPPTITLRAPKVEASNRFFRKFGQDRFLELKLGKTTHLAILKQHKKFFLKPFLLMHRVFRFLFVKDDTIIMFATEGVDLKPINIQQVIDWHMPITENWDMSISKYASRMSLGYSSSIPTLEFKPDEIVYVDDVYGSTGSDSNETNCMTDGCGIISCSAMKKIMGCQATEELPCAIQGRIAGAKGIWIIEPDLDFSTGDYIKIRKSQDKFKTGLPQSDFMLDPHHYTFDLVKNSILVYPSYLNTQFIQCLSHGGVPHSVFIIILKEYIHQLAAIITENQSIKLLRDWVAKSGRIMMGRWEGEVNAEKGLWRDLIGGGGDDENDSGFFTLDSPDDLHSNEDEPLDSPAYEAKGPSKLALDVKDSHFARVNKYSGFPASLHESIVRLLDAGFDLSNAYVATRVTMVFRQIMQAITTKYKIEVPQSCTVTCVPDPTGTLEPGEIFLQLSSRRVDEKTGIRAGQILGDVLVTRNPCALKSDVQKVKAVDCTALRMYTDLAIFSIKGETSLASQLSGGDYDGDIVFCCWDERLVKPFKPKPVPPPCKRAEEAFDKDKSTVGKEVSSCKDPQEAIQNSFISVAIPDGTLGVYENWRTVLAECSSLDHPDVVYLGHMCSKLVDAPKQGLTLKATVKKRDRANFSEIPHPPWFMDKKNKQRGPTFRSYKEANNVYTLHGAPCSTTMDYLYDTLLTETAAFTKYSRSMFCDDDVSLKDPDLIAPWLKAKELATQLSDGLLATDLRLIAEAVETNKKEYTEKCAKLDSLKQRYLENLSNPTKYVDEKYIEEFQSQFNSHFELEEFYAKDFLETPPTQSLKSNVMMFDVQVNGGRMLHNIKASYAYIISINSSKYAKYCYLVAYDNLRRIKADAVAKQTKENGFAETLSPSAYKCMTIDRNWIKKMKETNYTDGNERVRLSTEYIPKK